MYVYKCIYTLAQSCAYNWGGIKLWRGAKAM